MKKRVAIRLLAAPEDRDAIQGIVQQLRTRGMRIAAAGGNLRKKDVVIAVLSDRFYADEALRSQLFQQLAVGADTILPLKLGDSPIPEDIMNLLFSRNIIPVSGRDDAQVAERILDALPEKKSHLPLLLSVAAVVLLLLGGLFLWYSTREPEAEPVIGETEPVVYPWGITQEDLDKIKDIIIIGDSFAYFTYEDFQKEGRWPEVYDSAYEGWDDSGRHWYSTEDGHEYTLTRYDDLRFLELMPNLERLRMVLAEVETDMLPDLRGAQRLNYVALYDCNITDVEWIAADYVTTVDISGTDIADYSPLSQCDSLRYAYLDGMGRTGGDVSSFAPPALQELTICGFNTGQIDLSGLSQCAKLSRLTLDNLPVADLSFLEGRKGLQSLQLGNLHRLWDLSAISSLTGLMELRMWQCDGVTDYTPISACKLLRCLNIDRGNWIDMDSAFLNELTYLNDIGLFGLGLNNMDFLENLNQKFNISLAFAGNIQDYSGLAAINHYGWLHVNPRWNDSGNHGDYSLVAPYLENVSVSSIELYDCTNVDLANLPEINGQLVITKGDLEDLTGLSGEHLNILELRDMQYLRSLAGIENLARIHSGLMQLKILGCPRLMNYEALNGAKLRELDLVGAYTLPDFSEITLQTLCLESLEEMEDLRCLETLSTEGYYQFKFLGLDDLKDLSVLRNFKGSSLYVPPQVAEQAQDLVDRGNFSSFEVRYPEFGWNPMSESITLLSMEELETLPKAALRRVGRVWIAGDEIIDPDRYEFRHEWINDGPAAALYDRQTGETRLISMGTMTDLSLVAELTGLWELKLYCQPLTNLEGIQALAGLEWFDACFCPDLTDVSALFTLQRMHGIRLSHSGVESIQGVQNLDALWNLGLSGTRVTDLSPLAEVDYAAAQEVGGFNLEVDNCGIADFSALSAIPVFSNLNVCGHSGENWMPYVEQASIRCFCGPMDNDETLERFVRQHPELEEMHIESGYQITDLTPLLELENLSYMHIWDGSEVAERSLEGFERRFHMDAD